MTHPSLYTHISHQPFYLNYSKILYAGRYLTTYNSLQTTFRKGHTDETNMLSHFDDLYTPLRNNRKQTLLTLLDLASTHLTDEVYWTTRRNQNATKWFPKSMRPLRRESESVERRAAIITRTVYDPTSLRLRSDLTPLSTVAGQFHNVTCNLRTPPICTSTLSNQNTDLAVRQIAIPYKKDNYLLDTNSTFLNLYLNNGIILTTNSTTCLGFKFNLDLSTYLI